jgi:peptide/nickel transport system substrate-binding protein
MSKRTASSPGPHVRQRIGAVGIISKSDTTNFFPKMLRRDYVVGLNLQDAADPDQTFPLVYGCGSEFNRHDYCNFAVDKLIEQQSIKADQEKRKQLVWQIERKLAEDSARAIIFCSRGGTCWQPTVKGLTLMVNSIFNGNRREDIWLDR